MLPRIRLTALLASIPFLACSNSSTAPLQTPKAASLADSCKAPTCYPDPRPPAP